MKILIAGGTGFIGTRLSSRLVRERHEVTILTRSKGRSGEIPPGVSYLEGDPTQKGPWQEAIGRQDVMINLAGASIFGRWTDERKRLMRESRLQTTRNIVEGIPPHPAHPDRQATLISASAVGYYGFRGDEELTEDSPPGKDFLARLCAEWEEEGLRAGEKGAAVVITRFGIALGDQGGALAQMIPLFKRYLGGPIGSGRQWFSWIHVKDLEEAFVFLMRHPEVSGPVNLTSPHPVRNKDLAEALGKALQRPSFLPAPGFAVRLLLGEFGSVLLEGQRVIPRRLVDQGFVFQYPEIEAALRSLLPA